MSTFKSHVADVVGEIEHRAEDLPEHLHDARRVVERWGDNARRVVRKNPGLAVAGAFALGFTIAKLVRRA